jgi:hypothetical protein
VLLEDLMLLMEYGKCYLSNEEYEQRLAQRLNNYYAFLAQSLFRRKGKDFWKHHAQGLDRLGRFSWPKLVNATFREAIYRLVSLVLNPRHALKGMKAFFKTQNVAPRDVG